MELPVILLTAATVLYFLYKFAYETDTPKIPGLPEVPGLPFIGSLAALGDSHAKVTEKWSRKYGPVFQARLGNRVSLLPHLSYSSLPRS